MRDNRGTMIGIHSIPVAAQGEAGVQQLNVASVNND